MRKKTPRLIIAILAFSGWYLSGAVHEIGHAIVAKMAGLQVVHIQPWVLLGRVHVKLAGETTASWHAAVNISGMLFTVMVGIIGTVISSLAGRRLPALKRGVWLFVPMMCQSLAWVALPLAILLGATAPKDDVVKFMTHAGWHPAATLLTGLFFAALCALVMIVSVKRGSASQRLEPTCTPGD